MPLHDHPYSDVSIIYSVVQTGERTTDRGTNSAPNIKKAPRFDSGDTTDTLTGMPGYPSYLIY
jgi:hypothetical protein